MSAPNSYLNSNLLAALGMFTCVFLAAGSAYSQEAEQRIEPQQEEPLQDSIRSGQKVIESQITAFISEEYRRSFTYAAPEVRKQFVSVERFIWMVRHGYHPLFRPSQFRFMRAIEHKQKLYQEVEVRDAKGARYEATYRLVRIPTGVWRIESVSLKKATGKGI